MIAPSATRSSVTSHAPDAPVTRRAYTDMPVHGRQALMRCCTPYEAHSPCQNPAHIPYHIRMSCTMTHIVTSAAFRIIILVPPNHIVFPPQSGILTPVFRFLFTSITPQ